MNIITEILAEMAGPLTVALELAIMAAIGWAITVFERKTGIEVSEASEAKIKRAAATKILSYLAKHNLTLSDTTADQRTEMVREALNHVLGAGAGDSVKKIKASTPGLVSVIEGQMARLQIGDATTMPRRPDEPVL
ncbi:hypothetical protein [Marinovum algicola]|uniref:hypothetical protein n=1 Tax=Marinovum algicola TaxID=42444 RepID=UPI0024BAC343|nr:hypothetical protein [Marinovum algicola]